MTKVKKLEELIDAIWDSMDSIKHNRSEVDYNLKLMSEYENEYKSITGKYYRFKGKDRKGNSA